MFGSCKPPLNNVSTCEHPHPQKRSDCCVIWVLCQCVQRVRTSVAHSADRTVQPQPARCRRRRRLCLPWHLLRRRLVRHRAHQLAAERPLRGVVHCLSAPRASERRGQRRARHRDLANVGHDGARAGDRGRRRRRHLRHRGAAHARFSLVGVLCISAWSGCCPYPRVRGAVHARLVEVLYMSARKLRMQLQPGSPASMPHSTSCFDAFQTN